MHCVGELIVTLLAAVLAAVAVLIWWSPAPRARRLRQLSTTTSPLTREGTPALHRTDVAEPLSPHRWRVGLSATGLGFALALLFGGWLGVVLGVLGAAVASEVVSRMEPAARGRRRAQLSADLPLAAELLAACLRAGRPPDRAVEVVSHAIDGPLGAELAFVAETLRLGADADVAWSRFLNEPGLERFGRSMVRAWRGGAPLADILDRLADDARRACRTDADRRARAVGVKAALPLGVCFLPAFLLIGVIPLVAATITDLLH